MTFLLILSLIFPDFDNNGRVDFADFLLFVAHFGTTSQAYDLDSTGTVGFSDFILFVSHFGQKHPNQTFNLELIFLEGFTAEEREIITQAARRWEEVVVGDIKGDSDQGIDDIRVFVELDELPEGVAGLGGFTIYGGEKFPFEGSVRLSRSELHKWREDIDNKAYWNAQLFELALHEMGHVLGIGGLWYDFIVNKSVGNPARPGVDTHFIGALARQAFDQAGGTGYIGAKVPVENSGWPGSADSHWRESVFGDEIMSTAPSANPAALSAITVQALADIGYKVDVSKADPYKLP